MICWDLISSLVGWLWLVRGAGTGAGAGKCRNLYMAQEQVLKQEMVPALLQAQEVALVLLQELVKA
jgi:hypothetical protein